MADAPILIRGPMTLAYWLFFRGLALRRYARSIHPDLDENLKVWQVRSAVGDDPRFRALCRARRRVIVGLPVLGIVLAGWSVTNIGILAGTPLAPFDTVGFNWNEAIFFIVGLVTGTLLGDITRWRFPDKDSWISFIGIVVSFGMAYLIAIIKGSLVKSITLGILSTAWYSLIVSQIGSFVFGFASSVVFSVAAGVGFGVLFGLTVGVGVGIAGSLPPLVAFNMPVSGVVGFFAGMACGIAFGIISRVKDGMVVGLVGGSVFSITFGVPFGKSVGEMFGIAFLIAFTIAFLRLPFYLLELLRAMWLSAQAEREPTRAADLWWLQPLHYDDVIQLPLLGLPEHLAAIARSDPDACLNALADTGSSLRQHWAIPRALSLILHDELCRCTTLALIARFAEATAWLPSERFNADEQELLRALRNISANCAGALVGIAHETRERGLREQAEQVRKVRTNLGNLRGLQQGHVARERAEALERWQRTIEAEAAQVAHERIQSGELPMRYSAGAILEADDAAFQGRADIFRTLEELLVNAPNKITPLLLGQPRTGKSSALKQLPRRLGTHVLPVFINMESRAVAADAAGLLLDLSADIRAAAAQHVHPLDLPPLDEAALRSDPYRLFENWIRTIETLLGTERWLLLTLDEFNRIDDAVRGGRLDERIFFTLRNLIQHHPRIALALSGTFTLAECDPRWYEALKSVQTLPVSYLRPDEARNLLVKPAPDFPADVYSPPAIARALELTNGHPYLLHLLGATIVSAYNRKRADLPLGAPADTPLPTAAIDDAIPDLLRSGENALMSIWQWLLRIGGAQNAATLLETLARDQPIATLGDPDQRAELLALYCDRDLLAHDEHGNYHYRVPLLAHWIRAQRRLPRQ